MAAKSLAEVDLRSILRGKRYFPSPTAWEDQVLYFLLVDRFSDGNETGYRDLNGNVVSTGTTPPFQPADALNAVQTEADAARWRDAGGRYVGGTLAGVTSKLGYLARMGVTAVWLSPIFKQVAFQETYHGYGIQDYLQVNPRFGTADDLKQLVDTAHAQGIRVILDIILNHTGNVFGYNTDRPPGTDPNGQPSVDPRWGGGLFDVRGFNNSQGSASLPFVRTDPANPAGFPGPDDAIWPVEFQDPAAFTRKGRISDFDADPEFREGDFFDLKDVHQGWGPVDAYRPSEALMHQIDVYKYWMAFADLDGYRVDTVKHMDPGASRLLGSAMHEFAARIGKDNFYLIAEITGGRANAFDTLGITGLDAALGIDDIPDKLEFLAKGFRNPADYFNLFRNSELVGQGSHTWFRNKIVTLFNDHDQVSKGAGEGAVLCRQRPGEGRAERARHQCDDAGHSVHLLRNGAVIRRPRRWRRCRQVHPGVDVRRRVRLVRQPREALLRRGEPGLHRASEDSGPAQGRSDLHAGTPVSAPDFGRRDRFRPPGDAWRQDPRRRGLVATPRRSGGRTGHQYRSRSSPIGVGHDRRHASPTRRYAAVRLLHRLRTGRSGLAGRVAKRQSRAARRATGGVRHFRAAPRLADRPACRNRRRTSDPPQLHRGIAGSSVFLNYAVWESVARLRAAFTHPEFARALDA